jgi:hypothetical protein
MSLGKWEKYKVNQVEPPEQRDLGKWAKYRVSPEPEQNRSLLNKVPAWLLGLGQFGEDVTLGQAQGVGEPEVDIPEHWKPERIRKENMPEKRMPSLNLEQYVDPGKMGQFNTGRYGPALATALLGAGAGAFGAGKAIKGLTNKSIGNKIINDADVLQAAFKRRYGDFFGSVNEQLAEKMKASRPATPEAKPYYPGKPWMNKTKQQNSGGRKILGKGNFSKFKAASDSDINKPIKDFIKNPSPENAHWAKSSILTLERELKKAKVSRGLSPAENSARIAGAKMKKNLQKFLDSELNKLNPEFKQAYKNLGKEYKQYYAPYLGNRDIRKARLNPTEEGFIEPWRLPSKLYAERGDPTLRALSEKYPELYYNRMLAGPIGKSLLGLSIYKYGPKVLGER